MLAEGLSLGAESGGDWFDSIKVVICFCHYFKSSVT